MSKSSSRQNRDELRNLLHRFANLKAGLPNSFIEEDGFERIIEHFEDAEAFNEVLDACSFAINQYPYSASLHLIRANALIAVSYTHLDVYKRQCLYSKWTPALAAHLKNCLLYTSRCV